MSDFNLHEEELSKFEVLCSWSDIELMNIGNGWVPKGENDPMQRYIDAIDRVKCSKEITKTDRHELQVLREELFKARRQFIEIKAAGIFEARRKELLLHMFTRQINRIGQKKGSSFLTKENVMNLAKDYVLIHSGKFMDVDYLLEEWRKRHGKKGGRK